MNVVSFLVLKVLFRIHQFVALLIKKKLCFCLWVQHAVTFWASREADLSCSGTGAHELISTEKNCLKHRLGLV